MQKISFLLIGLLSFQIVYAGTGSVSDLNLTILVILLFLLLLLIITMLPSTIKRITNHFAHKDQWEESENENSEITEV